MNASSTQASLPTIVKYSIAHCNGIQSHNLTRYSIGYVLKGKKYIYYGDLRYEIKAGDIYYLGIGNHYTEDVPESGKIFEQIVFYYTQDQLSKILTNLFVEQKLSIVGKHRCEKCENKSHVVFASWPSMKSFFASVNQYLKDEMFSRDATAENLKIMELIYLIISNESCCLKNKILSNLDLAKESFEQIVHDHIFVDISVEELAKRVNMSLTSFKKEFAQHFFEPPHKWFMRQRFMHARLLLISTNKSVTQVGQECNFSNISHFIKLFKKEFGMTPAAYRKNNNNGESKPQEMVAREKVKV